MDSIQLGQYCERFLSLFMQECSCLQYLYMLTCKLCQGMSTIGDCRYRQAIPVGSGGRLDIDTNYGLRRSMLPQVKKFV